MKASDAGPTFWYRDRDLVRAALSFTAARTGFAEVLIEKDAICTLLLERFAGADGLVFKGGTCLAKVHTSFYRLSEDLDFVIPMATAATRQERSRRVAELKTIVAELPVRLPMVRLVEPLRGANASRQYLATVAYSSVISGEEERVKVEVGLREPLLEAPFDARATAVLRNPATDRPMVAPVRLGCISLREAIAEKARAALTRREPAIRDFFDLDYVARALLADLGEPRLVEMIRCKLAVPGNAPIDLSSARLADLRSQVGARLRPVLRRADFAAFDLDRAWIAVADLAARVSAVP